MTLAYITYLFTLSVIILDVYATSFVITKLDLTKESTDNSGIVRIYTEESVWPICTDNITLIEATVLCRQMGKGMAKSLTKFPIPNGLDSLLLVEKSNCFGNEETILSCVEKFSVESLQNCSSGKVVGLRCVEALANLVPDINSVESSVYVNQEPIHHLVCAIEENCLDQAAIRKYHGWTQDQLYSIKDTTKQWRRLLRFSSIIRNNGDAVFEPHTPNTDWQWHNCHGHFHSMSTFAIYQIFAFGTTSVNDRKGLLLAGHKASFCLEDNVCAEGVRPFYRCSRVKSETGTQGISPGCTDTYLHNIDCQWIDVTNLPYGRYLFRLVINPHILVAESNYHDNGIACELYYFSYYVGLHYCHSVHPLTMW